MDRTVSAMRHLLVARQLLPRHQELPEEEVSVDRHPISPVLRLCDLGAQIVTLGL